MPQNVARSRSTDLVVTNLAPQEHMVLVPGGRLKRKIPLVPSAQPESTILTPISTRTKPVFLVELASITPMRVRQTKGTVSTALKENTVRQLAPYLMVRVRIVQPASTAQ
jgi:hypothetical protein